MNDDDAIADFVDAGARALELPLGTYTHFVNLFDLCAVAIPSDRYANGVPIGNTLIGPAFADRALAALARRLVRTVA